MLQPTMLSMSYTPPDYISVKYLCETGAFNRLPICTTPHIRLHYIITYVNTAGYVVLIMIICQQLHTKRYRATQKYQ